MPIKTNTLSDIQYITPWCYAGFMVLKTGEEIKPGFRYLAFANDGEFPEWHPVKKEMVGKKYIPRNLQTVIVKPFRICATITD